MLGLTGCGYGVPDGYPELNGDVGASLVWVEDGEPMSASDATGCVERDPAEEGASSHFVRATFGDGTLLSVPAVSIGLEGCDVEQVNEAAAGADPTLISRRTVAPEVDVWTNSQGDGEGRTTIDGLGRGGAFWGRFEGRICTFDENAEGFVVCMEITEGRYAALP